MSEYFTEVTKITNISKHPNADRLEIIRIFGTEEDPTSGYPCIVQCGLWHKGDLAAYISVDACVPLDNPAFTWLAGKHEKTIENKKYALVKAAKLRGIFSQGILVPAPENATEGDNISEHFGIVKWEPEQNIKQGKGGSNQDNNLSGYSVKDPGVVPVYDLEGLKKYGKLFEEGEEVVVSEKMNGMNARIGYVNGTFYVGSRTQFKAENETNDFWRAAKKLNLEDKLKSYPDFIFWGELIGGVSDMRYGHQKGEPSLIFFDIYDVKKREFFSADDMKALLDTLQLPMVPIVYRGPYDRKLMDELAEKDSIYPNANHLSEGIVIRPIQERVEPTTLNRCVLKLVSQRYHLR